MPRLWFGFGFRADLKANLRTVTLLGLGVLICTWVACLLAMLVVSEHLEFIKNLSEVRTP